MNVLQSVWLGLTVLIGVVALIFIVVSLMIWIGERWKEFWAQWHEDKKQAILQEIGTELRSQKHWFCESEEAMGAIEAIGAQLQEDKHGVRLHMAVRKFRERKTCG